MHIDGMVVEHNKGRRRRRGSWETPSDGVVDDKWELTRWRVEYLVEEGHRSPPVTESGDHKRGTRGTQGESFL